jgi:hypothetical protein
VAEVEASIVHPPQLPLLEHGILGRQWPANRPEASRPLDQAVERLPQAMGCLEGDELRLETGPDTN